MNIIGCSKARAGSNGSVKEGIGGHAFAISDNSFTQAIWGHAQTVGSQREMTSLRVEHGGALGILLLLHAMNIFYQETFPKELTIYIDNSEVVHRGRKRVHKLGIKQQLVLDYNLCAITERLQAIMLCKILWEWVKGHYTQGDGSK